MLLSIAIPTYKRPELLLKTLRSICKQMDGYSDVSIQIFDDSCSLINFPVVECIKSEYANANIFYSVNDRNLGIDENIKKCLVETESTYVWLLGEDDLLVDGAVNKVLSIINSFSPLYIFANYIYTNDSHELFYNSAVVPEKRDHAVQVCFDDFIADHISALGFIGSCIIKREELLRCDLSAFVGSYYSHVGGIIETCLGRKIVVCSDIVVLNRAEDVNTFTWSSSTFEVYFSFFKVLRKSKLVTLPLLLKSVERSAKELFNVYSLLWLIAKRADGVYSKSVFNKFYLNNSDVSLIWKFFAYLVLLLPRLPLVWVRRVHLKGRFSRKSI